LRLLTLWLGLLSLIIHAPTHAAGKMDPYLDQTRRLLKHDTLSARQVAQ
jgi:hypothetical protein